MCVYAHKKTKQTKQSKAKKKDMQSISWSVDPNYDCTGMIDIPSVTPLEKTNFPSLSTNNIYRSLHVVIC